MPEFKATVSGAEQRRLQEFLEALRKPCTAQMNPKSMYHKPEFESDFRSRLLIHHFFIKSPLFQDGFDSALESACSQSGCKVKRAPVGQRFWDLEIDGRHISLKSTKARNLREETLHVSKLTEAAWIQDCRTAKKRRDETFRLFREYCSEVDAIMQLRYFAANRKYELVEIPVVLFKQILDVQAKHFAADGPTINIPIGKDPPDFTLKLDRSDAKITIANINKKRCFVHGTWKV
ncbi:MAG: hypothetical protein A3G83_04510 [Betaproteobacteria bacterium RIFCSPLOWO2_12_FULL_68_20]|nr:MAG: hypothetical protein A3G83_04510 [Betaproteobacteria bacterium RIFCSPLOWO2_12_FULL_68_20]